ncbi:uncharacterized protein si:ch211-171b20.3 [Polyodon spathula]|uniref:uncharacterized protein si:ch211-171b20.3 n=1 Tax=Polyodon spathula TaxID=7913 RepID=UPI001B7E19A7|nr:uncharacterized protein si:ch211-171b20.3 [Polyodon spathula]
MYNGDAEVDHPINNKRHSPCPIQLGTVGVFGGSRATDSPAKSESGCRQLSRRIGSITKAKQPDDDEEKKHPDSASSRQSAFSSLVPKEDQKRTTLDSDHKYLNEDFPERHFLFQKWNGVPGPQCENKALSLDMRLLKKNSVTRDPRRIQRLPLHKELFQGVSKPFAFGSYEGFHLTSEPAVFLPPCTTAISEKQHLTVDEHKNRSSNRTSSLYSIPGNQKSCAYADPVSGASSPFIQRLSEILSLESDTVRQEKMKKLKKNKKQES